MYDQPQRYPTVLGGGTIVEVGDELEAGGVAAEWSISETRCDRTYALRLKVQTNSPLVGPLGIISGLGIQPGDSYRFPLFSSGHTETDTGSFVTSIKAERSSDDGRQWAVTVQYTPFDVVSLLGNSDIDQGIINPTDRALEVYWGEPAKYRRSKPYDESGKNEETGEPGKPFLNTAGDPLIDPPETEETRPVLFIVRNESTYSELYASQYKDTVNADDFLNFPPNTVKCRDIKGERIFDPDWGWYHRVTYQFEFRDDDDEQGFTLKIASLGYRQLANGTGDPVNVTINGKDATDAVPLQEDGSYEPGEDPYFMDFAEFPSVAFEDLNIPQDILTIESGNT